MGLPRGVHELLLTDRPPGSSVTLTDPDGVRTLPTFTGQDGRSRVRVRTHRAGEYTIRAGGGTELSWRVDREQPPAGRLLRRSGGGGRGPPVSTTSTRGGGTTPNGGWRS